MKIEWLCAEDKNYWNIMVDECPNSEVYHLFEWTEIIRETYRVKVFRPVVEEEGKMQVALPLVFFNNPFIGRKLVSLPFCDYGGFFGNPNRPEAISLLLREIIRLAYSLGANFVELRMLARKDENMRKAGFNPGLNALTYRLTTDRPYEEILKQYSKKIRKNIKKSEREGLRVYEATGRDDLEIYYGLYLQRMMELGTPPAPKKFWINLWDHFWPQRFKLIFTLYKGIHIAAFAALIHKKRLYFLLNVSDSRQWKLRGLNDTLFDWYIRFACEEGIEEVDFGRTRYGTGVMEFKEKGWGCFPLEVCKYYHYLHGGENPLDRSLQSNFYAKAWRRFIPRMAAPALGYVIRKNAGDA